jgi:hypothetical protein
VARTIDLKYPARKEECQAEGNTLDTLCPNLRREGKRPSNRNLLLLFWLGDEREMQYEIFLSTWTNRAFFS